MKHRSAVLLAGLVILPRLALAQEPKASSKSAPSTLEAAAIAQEQRVLQAVLRGDLGTLNQALGLPTLMVGSDGSTMWTAEATAAFLKDCKTTSLEPSEFRTVTAGKDVVVVSYKAKGSQTCKGQATPPLVNALSVWQRRGDRWSLVAHSEVPLELGPGAAAPAAEQTISRLRFQWNALLLASMASARARGQSPVEYGSALGKVFASSWSNTLTPQGLARGMSSNIQLVGLKSELVEDTPERAVVRFSLPDSTQSAARYADLGVSPADWAATMQAVCEQIAAAHGLVWEQRREGASAVATVTRKQ